jgi:predicted metal-dependent phosphoesterase TrpH
MGAADLHMHSVHSDGTSTVGAILNHASECTDLDVIAITDHNTLRGALVACEMAAQFRVEVIPGVEISTREGHLLALFLDKPVPPGLSYVETAERVRLLGGLPFAPHPAGALVSSIGAVRLRRIAARFPGLLAGVEAANGSLPLSWENRQAEDLRWELQMPGIGNSDAHLLTQVGCARTAFAGSTAADLRTALEAGTVVPLPVRRNGNYVRGVAMRWAWRWVFGLADTLDVKPGSPHQAAARIVRLARLHVE